MEKSKGFIPMGGEPMAARHHRSTSPQRWSWPWSAVDILVPDASVPTRMFNVLLNVLSSNGLITQQEWFEELDPVRLERTVHSSDKGNAPGTPHGRNPRRATNSPGVSEEAANHCLIS